MIAVTCRGCGWRRCESELSSIDDSSKCANCGRPYPKGTKQTPTPRPHYKERIAHAAGYEIQVRAEDTGEWLDDLEPFWHPCYQYRVKPESKPDVVRELLVTPDRVRQYPSAEKPNLLLTFDGETGQLKSAEVIQQS